MGSRQSLAKQVEDLEYKAATLEKLASKAQTQSEQAREEAKKAHKKGLLEIAKTHARSMQIADKQASTLYAMSARTSALVFKMQHAKATGELTASIKGLSASLSTILKDTSDIDSVMETFEERMEEVDRVAGKVGGGVDKLHKDIDEEGALAHIAEEAALEIVSEMPTALASATQVRSDEADLELRYAQLA